MVKLYIIGNGFDLAHDLRTRYKDFADFVLTQTLLDNPEFKDIFISPGPIDPKLRTPERLLRLATQNPGWIKNKLFHKLCTFPVNNNWYNIESAYYQSLVELVKNTSNFKLRAKNMNELHHDMEAIKKYLIKYLSESTKGANLFRSMQDILKDNSVGVILNFNYTNLIEKYITGIPHISKHIKIHGSIDDNIEEVIFGYGDSQDENYINILNYGHSHATSNLKGHLYHNKKHKREVLDYLDSYAEVYVEVLGHSFSLCDRDILKPIVEHKNVVSIKPFLYQGSKSYQEFITKLELISLGIKDDKLIDLDDCIALPQNKNVE